MKWSGGKKCGKTGWAQAGRASNASLRNLELCEGTWGPLKAFERADHKWQGAMLRCVLGEVNWVVEQRTGFSGEKLTAAWRSGRKL